MMVTLVRLGLGAQAPCRGSLGLSASAAPAAGQPPHQRQLRVALQDLATSRASPPGLVVEPELAGVVGRVA